MTRKVTRQELPALGTSKEHRLAVSSKDVEAFKRRVRRRITKMKSTMMDACAVKVLSDESEDDDAE